MSETADMAWMEAALAQAQAAGAAGEVPVGAVVVRDGHIIGVGRNAPIASHDPTAHAEIAALRAAAQHLGNYRLDDCELFVTLEPCTMCAGAMLHARLKRVVFGAPDPKTGAAGSVSNVFTQPQLNHHTQVQGGVLQETCAKLLQDFFKHQRTRQQLQAAQAGRALREDALRTPERCFASLTACPAPSFYLSDLPSLAGLRLHFLDTGAAQASGTQLCLHGVQEWSYAWCSQIQQASAAGQRVICPDLIGFGKSDKPKKKAFHTLGWHAQVLLELIQRLGLPAVQLVVAESALSLAHKLQMMAPQSVVGIVVAQTDALGNEALYAPYPDKGHLAGPQAFSSLKILPSPCGSSPSHSV
ncbi:tRNA adenosine(34) deaminase TadA [Rhodoferax sp. U11-2br]|uniref:tRNA adenosine(34) deaminase TadA n=1 Tax=Rhodoferax sp. U11-2br TaxID=2838878 RepID=UPI00352CDAC4